ERRKGIQRNAPVCLRPEAWRSVNRRSSSRIVWRQLLFPVSDNYFSLSTTITLEAARSAAAATAGDSPPSGRFFGFERQETGVIVAKRDGKVGNLLLVFHFSRPLRPSCGNVEISPPFGEISKGLVERVGSLLLAFHSFHSPGIS